MKKIMIVVLALVVFVTAAFAAVSLENVRTLADVESVLGTATAKGNDGTDYLSYSSVSQAFVVSKWVRVNTPAYPNSEVPVGAEVAQGSPCTIRLHTENIEDEQNGAVNMSTLITKDQWKVVAENGLLTDLNDGSNGFTLVLIKKIKIDSDFWILSNGQPLPEGEVADLGLVSVYPNTNAEDIPGVISSFKQLNDYCQGGKGQITASEFPFAWLFIPQGEPAKVSPTRMPTIKSNGEVVAQDEQLLVGTTYLVVDGDAFFEFAPSTLEEKMMLGLPGYLNRSETLTEGDNKVVVVKGMVARWKVKKGFSFQTEQATLGADEIAEQGAWGTLRGNYVSQNPNTSNGEGGGGGGCNAGNFGVLGLFAPAFALVLQRKRS